MSVSIDARCNHERSWSYFPDLKLLPKIEFSKCVPDFPQYPQLIIPNYNQQINVS